MHSSLAGHLHTNKCVELIELLNKCHTDNPFKKFLGACNLEDRQMVKCLKNERIARQKRNFEKSKQMKEKVKQRLIADGDYFPKNV